MTLSDQTNLSKIIVIILNPPASEASREVTNLTERKNLHAPLYGFREDSPELFEGLDSG